MKKILVTGGTGYIGSHTVVELINNNYDVVIVDDYSNSNAEVLNRIEMITGKRPKFYNMNISNRVILEEVFKQYEFDAVIHFAGYKAVGESVEKPLRYYQNNLVGTLVLCELMEIYGVYRLIFSSSATVYGGENNSPINENAELCPTNPYGQTKLMIESIINDICLSNKNWSALSLRYFNPIGAHTSGLIGEAPNGIPNNLMPYISQVAMGIHPEVLVYGDDYKTKDGTGVRDYIHVMDLADGHIKALEYVLVNKGVDVINIGTGKGYSVLDLIKSFSKSNGINIPYKIVGRRSGDVDICYADVSKSKDVLNWVTKRTLDNMCCDTWKWQCMNPNGYEGD